MKKLITIIAILALLLPITVHASQESILDDLQDIFDNLDDMSWDELGYIATSDYSQYEFVGLYDSETGNLIMLPNMGATKYYNASDWTNAHATGYNEAVSYYWYEIDELLPDFEEAIDDLEILPSYEQGYSEGYDMGYSVGLGEGATIDDFRCDLIEL